MSSRVFRESGWKYLLNKSRKDKATRETFSSWCLARFQEIHKSENIQIHSSREQMRMCCSFKPKVIEPLLRGTFLTCWLKQRGRHYPHTIQEGISPPCGCLLELVSPLCVYYFILGSEVLWDRESSSKVLYLTHCFVIFFIEHRTSIFIVAIRADNLGDNRAMRRHFKVSATEFSVHKTAAEDRRGSISGQPGQGLARDPS